MEQSGDVRLGGLLGWRWLGEQAVPPFDHVSDESAVIDMVSPFGEPHAEKFQSQHF